MIKVKIDDKTIKTFDDKVNEETAIDYATDLASRNKMLLTVDYREDLLQTINLYSRHRNKRRD